MDQRILAAVLLMLCAGLTRAGVNSWTGIGPPGGNTTEIVYSSTPGTVFALVGQGVYRSRDGGTTWQAAMVDFALNPPRGLAVDPSDSTRVYVTAPQWPSIYVSTDGGSSFQPLTAIPTAISQASEIAVSEDGGTLYVSNFGRLFRSADRGLAWTEITTVPTASTGGISRLHLEPGDPNTIYVSGFTNSTEAALLRTRDGGLTWTVLYSGVATNASIFDLAVSRANPAHVWIARADGLFRSTDRGATWTPVRTGAAYATIALDPAAAGTALAGTPQGAVSRTLDGGASWQDVSAGLRAGQLLTLALDPGNSARALVGSLSGIWGTSNSGSSWTARNSGLLSSNVEEISADTDTGRIYFNKQSDGLYYAVGQAPPQPVDNIELGDLQPGPQYVISMLAQPGRLFAALTAGLARSTDGGTSWSLQQVVPPGSSQQLFELQSSPLTPQSILAAGNRGVYRSTDGGLLWTVAGNGLPAGADIGRLRVAPSDGRVGYATLYNSNPGGTPLPGLYRTADGGQNWVPATTDPALASLQLLAVDPSAASTLYAVANNALIRSTDGGSSWSTLTWSTQPGIGMPAVFAVDPVNSQFLYAANVMQVARSVDNGLTWEILRDSTQLPRHSPQQLFVDPFQPATLLLSTYSSGVQHLAIAPDLQLTGIGASPVGIGMPMTYAFTLRNNGPFTATAIGVTLRWTPSAQGVSLQPSSGHCAVAAQTAVCTLPILRSGSTATITLVATATELGTFETDATVIAGEADPVLTNNSLLMTGTVGPRADLALTTSGPSSVQSGDTVNYTLTLRNTGPDTAQTPTLSFQLAPMLAAGVVTASNGTCSTSAAGLVTCIFGNIAPNASVTVGVAAIANSPGSATSTALVTSVTPDAVSTDNQSAINTSVVAPPTLPAPNPPAGTPTSGGGGALTPGELLGMGLLAVLALGRQRRYSRTSRS
jgi:uncharacterized repeat protein (TIGR01451 family)